MPHAVCLALSLALCLSNLRDTALTRVGACTRICKLWLLLLGAVAIAVLQTGSAVLLLPRSSCKVYPVGPSG